MPIMKAAFNFKQSSRRPSLSSQSKIIHYSTYISFLILVLKCYLQHVHGDIKRPNCHTARASKLLFFSDSTTSQP